MNRPMLGRYLDPINLNKDGKSQFISLVICKDGKDVVIFREPFKVLGNGQFYVGDVASMCDNPKQHSYLVG